MFSIRLLPCLFACLAGPAAASIETPPPTNMDLLVQALEEVAEEALSGMETAAGDAEGTVLIQPQASHAANWMVDQILAGRLLSRGYGVVLDSTAARPGELRLAYRILDLGLTGRTGLGSSQVERRARAAVAFSLIREGELQWEGEFTRIVEDRVSRKQIGLLGNASYGFSKIQIEEQSLGTFVEPVIVSTVLGSLVYLFFSSR